LTATATVVGGVGVAFVVVPFLKSWSPSERAKAAGAPVEADISKLEEGAMMTVEWRGKPVWLLKRSKKMLDDLPGLKDQLLDPGSQMASQQPKYAQNANRSIKPEVLVLVGICTHLGCPPIWGRTGKAAFSAPATAPASIWPGASTKAFPRPRTWRCLPIGTSAIPAY
jgi:ubiquinol-cytochrome c reductase iron-sulfur subunit